MTEEQERYWINIDRRRAERLAEIEAERAKLPPCDKCGKPGPLVSERLGRLCEECYSTIRQAEIEAEGIIGRCAFCGFPVTQAQPNVVDFFDSSKVAHRSCYQGQRFDELEEPTQ